MDDGVKSANQQAAEWLLLMREEPEDEALRQRFETWLDADPFHARAWVSVSDTFETIGETSPELRNHWGQMSHPAPPRHNRGERHRWEWRRVRRIGRLRLGACAIAAVLAIWFAPFALLHMRSDHMTTAGEVSSVRLADGSMVQLGPQSAIAIRYQDNRRTISLLAGEAWFDVWHNPTQPFHVLAGQVETVVLGTSFDVRRIGRATDVSVREGRVRVIDKDAATPVNRDLTAGRWAHFSPEHNTAEGTINPGLMGLWRDGSIVARNRTIAEVVNEIRPWYGGRILLLNAQLGQRKVDGVYDGRDPEGALRAVAEHAGGRVRSVTPWLLILT